MAFKASSQIPARGYAEAKFEAMSTKTTAMRGVSDFTNGGNADQIYAVLRRLEKHRVALERVRSVPGIAQYARDQEDDQTYDVVAEFNALITTLETAINWIKDAIPKSGEYDLMYTRNGTVMVARVFPAASLSGLVAQLQAISDSVE